MRKLFKSLAIIGILGAFAAPAAMASEHKEAENFKFSFEGPFGTFDRAQLQRGFLVYKEVCAACHGLNKLSYRNLGEPGGPEFSEAQVKAIAAEAEVTDGPNGEGEMFTRPGKPSDRFVSPFPNDEAAKASNNGALPPDLSLITKARSGWHGTLRSLYLYSLFNGSGGPEYVKSLLSGYKTDDNQPACMGDTEGNFNEYFAPGGYPAGCEKEVDGPDGEKIKIRTVAGSLIAMPPPLSEDAVEYADGTKATVPQMAEDVAAFLAWTAEPKLEQRKHLGLLVLLYMAVFTILLYLVKKAIWSNVKH